MSFCVTLFVHCFIALSLIEVWITECKNLSTMVLRNWVFSTLECHYFLCFGHSYFIIIDIDIAQMKSNLEQVLFPRTTRREAPMQREALPRGQSYQTGSDGCRHDIRPPWTRAKSNFIFSDKIIVTTMKYIKSVFDHFFCI